VHWHQLLVDHQAEDFQLRQLQERHVHLRDVESKLISRHFVAPELQLQKAHQSLQQDARLPELLTN